MTLRYSLLVVVLAAACGGETEPEDTGGNPYFAPPDPSEGFQVGMTVTAAPGEEVWKCLVMDALPWDDRFAYINRGEHKQNPAMHHMDLMSLAFVGLEQEPGMYDCDELYADPVQAEKLMDDGLILYAGQQGEDSVTLPPGVVAEVPTQTPFLYEVHYVNTTDQEVEINSYLNAYTILPENVTNTIWGGPVRDRYINVPAGADEHIEWTRCVMDKPVDVVFISSHTHELARNFQIRLFDGETVSDEVIYENGDWQSPFLQDFDPPLRLEAGQGVEFSCIYKSNRDTDTHWGFTAQDEMCQIGLVFTPGNTNAECVVVETSDGVIMP